jgi:hypothetical protein
MKHQSCFWFYSLALAGLIGFAPAQLSAAPRDTSTEEATCRDIGFRPKTVAFADCVMKLLARGASLVSSAPLSPDEQTCKNYGFGRGTAQFSQCLMQLEQVTRQAQNQQNLYELQVAQYQQQQSQFEAQQKYIKEERDRRKWAAIGRLGAGMANSTSSSFLGALNEGLAAANGVPISRPAPEPPSRPVSQNYTVRLPNGNQIYCNYNTAASYMNCR